MGGQGMGVASTGAHPRYVWSRKKMDMKAPEAAELLHWRVRQGDKYFIFHTRLCSAGEVSDGESQPFIRSSLGKALAHNGTELSLTSAYFDMYSDTHIMSELFFQGLWHWSDFKDHSTVFVGFDNGKPFITKYRYGGDLELGWFENGGWIAASFISNVFLEKGMTVQKVHAMSEYVWHWSRSEKIPVAPAPPKIPVYTYGTDRYYHTVGGEQGWYDGMWEYHDSGLAGQQLIEKGGKK